MSSQEEKTYLGGLGGDVAFINNEACFVISERSGASATPLKIMKSLKGDVLYRSNSFLQKHTEIHLALVSPLDCSESNMRRLSVKQLQLLVPWG